MCTVSVNTSFCKGCSPDCSPGFPLGEDRPAVVLLRARCGRTVLLEETALSVGSANNLTVHFVALFRTVGLGF